MHVINLGPWERRTLEEMRDHHPKPYVRERAAGLLKVAGGTPAVRVAKEGLLRPRVPDTLYAWIAAYKEGGIAGLYVKKGRGRISAFHP